jgi:hypothetical protein
MKMVQRAFALVSFVVLLLGLSGPGCGTNCREDQIAINSNGRAVDSNYIGEYFCIPKRDSVSPAPEPDISGTWPLDVGPKDPDAVVKMAILIQTCLPSIQVVYPLLNWRISEAYFDYLRDAERQAMYSRSGCFKDKFNGCDAVRECLGIVQEAITLPGADSEPPKPLPTDGCVDGIRRRSSTYRDPVEDTVSFGSTWVNCKGLGLECYDEYQLNRYWCTSARTPCEPEETVSSCLESRTYRCWDDRAKNHANYYYEKPQCWDFGLSCEEQNGYPWYKPNEEWSDCIGTGATCKQDTIGDWVGDDSLYSYTGGIVCESETVLRACVGLGEKQIDCLQLGKGFKCISEGQPHCGFAAECTKDTPVTCEGDSLVVCDAGRIRKVDCKTLGFTTCDEAHSACGPNSLY